MQISVVIPVYNEEKYIETCLQSLKKQTVKPTEIIIVDNNCTDKTLDIARKFNVRIVKENKQGITFARNSGFNKTVGDIIARCDADSILPSNWIKKIKTSFTKKDIDALSGPLSIYDPYPFVPKKIIKAYLDLFFKICPKLARQSLLYGPNYAIRRKMWNKVKNKLCRDDARVHEDFDLAFHINAFGGKILFDQKQIVKVSSRRAKNKPLSFFVEYPKRFLQMLNDHDKLL